MDIKKERTGVKSIYFKEERDFKILQLTDIHIGAGILSIKQDKLALESVRLIIEESKPDFIIVTGDLVYPIPIFSGSINNLKAMKKIASVIEEYKIPWTIAYGNHDVEPFALYNKDKISSYLESLEYCIFDSGDKDIDGQGNQVIKIYQKEKIINALFVLDSNMYVDKGFFSGFDHIHDNQIEWYEKELEILKKENADIKTLMFFHIPCSEYKTAWREFTDGNVLGNVKYLFGDVGEHNEYFGVPKNQTKIFDKVLKLGSTKAIFCGHDHLNTMTLEYKGITLTYGMSIDFLAYNGIMKNSRQRGGTEIYLDKNGDFNIKQLKLISLDGGYINKNKYI